ncbi:DUF4905 domain-containing protein [Olivibacter sp. SDN3]|uniref:DUF4905 domain-containing protein n=1 Tax=Olivibacter sp. SDN3 TaxID=2764720 RepID=UPI0016513029|nr:DUF4905 domain-containing protein [Olivibacter sp. SDN3]QNL49879.1 DUF4905 domain-containing protein [Olivibacter sp. SDN3]
MEKAFDHIFAGAIWKMDIHEIAELLAIEWRDSSGQPHFAVIHYPSGRLLFDEVTYGNRWWTLAAVTAQHLLLQHYPSPDQAVTQGLVAIDIHKKDVVWEVFNYQFQELAASGIVVKQLAGVGKHMSVVDEHSGAIVAAKAERNQLNSLPRNIHYALPTPRTPSLPLTTTKVVGPYFLLEKGTREFWAFHEQKEKGYRVRFAVIVHGQILFNEIMIDNLSYLLPELFFMVGEQLFFIRNNKREIASYFV